MTTDTTQPDRYVRASDWARILAALALPASSLPADVIAAIEAKTAGDRAQADRDERAAALRECHLCDDFGWLLDELGVPAEPARKCDHGRNPHVPNGSDQHHVARSFSEPARGELDDEAGAR